MAFLAQSAGSKLSIQGTLVFHSPVGHTIECHINRVTVRFITQGAFELRQGVVQPVAERVFAQIKATSVLSVSRILTLQPKDAEQKTEAILTSLSIYADLLGVEWADKEMVRVREQFASLTASPATAKQTVADAHRFIRATKEFNQ